MVHAKVLFSEKMMQVGIKKFPFLEKNELEDELPYYSVSLDLYSAPLTVFVTPEVFQEIDDYLENRKCAVTLKYLPALLY